MTFFLNVCENCNFFTVHFLFTQTRGSEFFSILGSSSIQFLTHLLITVTAPVAGECAIAQNRV